MRPAPHTALVACAVVCALLPPTGSLLPGPGAAPLPSTFPARHAACLAGNPSPWTPLLAQGVGGDRGASDPGNADRAGRPAPVGTPRESTSSLFWPLRLGYRGGAEYAGDRPQGGVRARLGRRLASIRDSRRIASFRQLLRNATEWEGEWLSPDLIVPEKVLGSVRLARTVAIMSDRRGSQEVSGEAYSLDEGGIRRMQSALTRQILEAEAELEAFADSGELAAEDRHFQALIDQWALGIAAAYGEAGARATTQTPSRAPLAGVNPPSFASQSSPTPQTAQGATANHLAKWPQAAALRAQVAETPELRDLTDFDLHRFLALSKGDASKALKMLLAHRMWLDGPGYGLSRVADVNPSTPGMRAQIRSGKCFLLNKPDCAGRPVVLVRVDKHLPAAASVDESTLFIVMCLKEAESRLADPDSSQFSVLLDLGKASISNIDYPLIKRLIYILTNFYPERLGVMLLHDAPSYFTRCVRRADPCDWLKQRASSSAAITHP